MATFRGSANRLGITSHCDGCTTFHIENAIRHGATRKEVAEAIGVAVVMGGGPAIGTARGLALNWC